MKRYLTLNRNKTCEYILSEKKNALTKYVSSNTVAKAYLNIIRYAHAILLVSSRFRRLHFISKWSHSESKDVFQPTVHSTGGRIRVDVLQPSP